MSSISTTVSESKMSALQVRAVAIAIFLVVVEGYDVALTAFTAPFVRTEFSVSASVLGLVLSGALIGMFVGSVFVAPVADRIGRRITAIGGIAIVTVGMAIGPVAQDVTTLFVSRVVTGIGVGALIAVSGVIVSEYANRRTYSVVMAVFAAGMYIGGVLASLLVGPLVPDMGWRFAYVVGAVLSAAALVATWGMFPESIAWLAEGRRANSLRRLNTLLAKMNQRPLTELPASDHAEVKVRGAVRTIFSRGLRWQTILMIVSYLLFMIGFYFVNMWAPTAIANANADPALAAPGTLAMSLGGVIGTILFGFIAIKVNPRILTPVFVIVGTIGVVVFGLTAIVVPHAYVTIAAAAFFFAAGVAGFYLIVPRLYPTLARATGYGAVIGVGRLGGIAAPIVGGVAFDSGLATGAIFAIFAAPLLASALGVVALHLGLRGRSRRTTPTATQQEPVSV